MLLQITGAAAISIAGLAVYAFAMGVERLGGVIAAAATIAALELALGSSVDPTLMAMAAFLAFSLGAVRARPLFESKAVGILIALVGAAMIAAGDLRVVGEVALYTGLYIASIYAQILQSVAGMGDPTGGIFVVIAMMIAASFLARYISAIGDPLIASIAAFGVAYLAVYVAAVALFVLISAVGFSFEVAPIIVLIVGAAAVVDMFNIFQRPRPEAVVWLGPLAVVAQATIGVSLAPLISAIGLLAAITAILSGRTSMYVTAIFLAFSALAVAS